MRGYVDAFLKFEIVNIAKNNNIDCDTTYYAKCNDSRVGELSVKVRNRDINIFKTKDLRDLFIREYRIKDAAIRSTIEDISIGDII